MQGCVFFGFHWYFSHLGGKIDKENNFWGVSGRFQANAPILKRSYYRNYCIDHIQILHSD